MRITDLEHIDEYVWRVDPREDMLVPAIIYADTPLLEAMDDKVLHQSMNVAKLPGIVGASYAMPDAHWGYGFPIGGVAAFDPDQGGVISAGGVGFDISCGVRTLHTGLNRKTVASRNTELADALYSNIPCGMGSTGKLRLGDAQMDAMLRGGAQWAVAGGYGESADLERTEEYGRMSEAQPEAVSRRAKERQRKEMGTLGSGNHYLELQTVAEIFDPAVAAGFGLDVDEVLVSIHCGSRGLGHQIGTEFLKEMAESAKVFGIRLPDRELACAPLASELGQRYLGAMRAAINCALANRQIITHLVREVFADVLPEARLRLLYDVSHNTCKLETHVVDGESRQLFVHRKGATRAFGAGHTELPGALRDVGQPVLIGGSMGTESHILCGVPRSETLSFSSACHGAGRSMSRRQASRTWRGRQVVDELAARGTIIRSPSPRGVAEEAPGAYKDVGAVVDTAHRAGLARKVARLTPMVCIKG
ncbi:MAG: RtcB family protein [Gammaproteobacteria bacterium]|nr:RtcB family protein [Gammaproteobacteria bacterium]